MTLRALLLLTAFAAAATAQPVNDLSNRIRRSSTTPSVPHDLMKGRPSRTSRSARPSPARTSGLFIDKDDNLFSVDSESNDSNHPGWKRGMRIGSAKDGSVKYFIPDPESNPTSTSAAEGVAADGAGNLYGAEVGPKAVEKYVRK